MKRSGSASASASAKRWAKSLTAGHFAFGVSGTITCSALAAGQHREGLQAHVGEMALQIARRLLHLLEIEALVGIEIEHEPVGLLDVGDLGAPAVEFDRPHLHAGEHAGRVLDVEIILLVRRPSPDRHVEDMRAERAAVVLLEEALLRRGPAGSGPG